MSYLKEQKFSFLKLIQSYSQGYPHIINNIKITNKNNP